MKTRGKRTGADDEKPADETEEKPVRKRAKKKANHVSEETEDPPCEGKKSTKTAFKEKKKAVRKPTTEKQTVKEEIPKTIVKKLSAKKKKYEADISSPEKQLNKVKTTDKKSEFFTDVQKEKALPKVKQKPKGKHVRALYDIEKVDQSSENDFQINSKNDVKSKSKKRNPVKGKAKSKKAVQDTGNLKVEEGIDKNHEESCEELKGMSENSESESDWEEVEELPGSKDHSPLKSQLPDQPIEITLEGPLFNQKRKKKGFDMEAWFKRKMNRYQRELQEDMHKVHLICLVVVGLRCNNVLNCDSVKAMAMSLVPSEFTRGRVTINKVNKVTKWFCQTFTVSRDVSDSDQELENQICEQYSERKVNSVEELTYLYVALLRTLNMAVRLVVSLNPVPLRASKAAQEKASKQRKAGKNENIPSTSKEKSPKVENTNKIEANTKETYIDVEKETNSKIKTNRKSSKTAKNKLQVPKESKKKGKINENSKSESERVTGVKRSRRRVSDVNYKEREDNEDDGDDDIDDDDDVKKGGVSPAASDVMEISSTNCSDSDFEVEETSFRSPPSKKKIKIVSSGSEESVKITKVTKNTEGKDHWAEVYLEDERKWICVDVDSCKVDCHNEMESQVTKPMTYFLAWDNDNSIKDVTRPYANNWQSQTRKLRVDADWWEETLLPYKSTNQKREAAEDEHIQDLILKKPLPTAYSEYKNHPLYALKRHLLKFESIYPDSAVPVGYFKGEPVYARDCVHTLHTRQTWLKEARVVRIGETAYKHVKGRPKMRDIKMGINDIPQIEIFGRWQTEEYIPPPAVDGKVPRNEYGNVELFLPSMLPKGTVHLQIAGLNRIARKLNIDCVPAMVGFDAHAGGSHPVLDGSVVCEEFKDALLAAYEEDIQIQNEKQAQKREERAMKNWKLLVKSILIKERLKKRFDLHKPDESAFCLPSTSNDTGEKATDLQQAWPQNRKDEKQSKAKKTKKTTDKNEHTHRFPFEEL